MHVETYMQTAHPRYIKLEVEKILSRHVGAGN